MVARRRRERQCAEQRQERKSVVHGIGRLIDNTPAKLRKIRHPTASASKKRPIFRPFSPIFSHFHSSFFILSFFCRTFATSKAPMAESVDASVSNTDRATCAGSTPARSTGLKKKSSAIQAIAEDFFSTRIGLNRKRRNRRSYSGSPEIHWG